MPIKNDLTGKIIGDLKVVKQVNEKEKHLKWLCKCVNCGFEVIKRSTNLINRGQTKCKKCNLNEFIEYENYYECVCSNGDKFMVDKEFYYLIKTKNWFSRSGYALCCFYENNKRTQLEMAYLILPKKDGFIVDHKDGNTFDNRKSNLRYATRTQNCANSKKAKNKSSIYKGVSKVGKKWVSYIYKDLKRFSIGTFSNEVDAAKAYNSKAVEFFGEFARLNTFG